MPPYYCPTSTSAADHDRTPPMSLFMVCGRGRLPKRALNRSAKGHRGGLQVRVAVRVPVRPRRPPGKVSTHTLARPNCSNSAAPGGSQGRFAPDPRRGLTTARRGASIEVGRLVGVCLVDLPAARRLSGEATCGVSSRALSARANASACAVSAMQVGPVLLALVLPAMVSAAMRGRGRGRRLDRWRLALRGVGL